MPSVLLIDDSKSLIALLSERMTELGYEPFTAMDGKCAIDEFRKSKPEVVVIDYHLPDMKGDELLYKFLAEEPKCICIMMTSDPSPELTVPWIKAGASAYVRKPFEPEYLVDLCDRARRERNLQNVQKLLEARTAALHDSEFRYKDLMDSLPVGVYRTSMDGKLIEASQACFDLLNCPPEEYELLKAADTRERYANPDDAQTIRELLKKDGKIKFYETALLDWDGKTRWFSNTAKLVRDENGEPLSIDGVLIDIDEKKRVEDELDIESHKNKAILEALPDLVFHMDADGNYLDGYANDVNKLLVPPEQFIGQNCQDVLPPYLGKLIKECISKTLQEGKLQTAKYELDIGDETRFYEARSAPFKDKAEVIAVVRDVTEETRLQKHIIQVQKEECVGRMASGVAHDLNNMLSPILAYSEMLVDTCDLEGSPEKYAKEVRKGALRARELVRKLLAFSRKQEFDCTDVCLNETVEQFEGLLRKSIPKSVDLQFSLQPSLGMVRADVGQIEQVLMNLVVNAADAMPDGGDLKISTDELLLNVEADKSTFDLSSGKFVTLTVTDTGIGMDKQTVSKIFEPFFTTKGKEGTGLGLSTAYGIIKQHGGTIMVDSEPGKGTTFDIYLPAVS